MESPRFEVTVSAGSLRPDGDAGAHFAHQWTEEGVVVESDFTGGHLFQLATAACVLNDAYREARTLRIEIAGVRVHAAGAFDTETWASTGVVYEIEVDSPADAGAIDRLVAQVERVAEIPKALGQPTTVTRRATA